MDVPNKSQLNNNTKDLQVSVQLEGEKNPIQCQLGKHLIAFWVEGNKTKSHLGVVEGTENDNSLVSYMIRTDTKGKSWTYPESAEVLLTSCDQFWLPRSNCNTWGQFTFIVIYFQMI